jgi:hypothetical protein
VSQNDQPADQTTRVAGLVGQIGCVTGFVSIVIIAIGFAAGRFLDNYFDAGGLFTVLLLLASFPITLYLIVRISLYAIGRAQQPADEQLKREIDTNSTSEEEPAA